MGKSPTQNPPEPSGPTAANIEAIGRLEAQAMRDHSWSEHVANVITRLVGSGLFLIIQTGWFAIWIAANVGLLAPLVRLRPFDPYPFPLLSMLVSSEAVVISTFVLIKQNRMSRRADERAHLGLQLNMLAEQEATKTLQILEQIARRLGLDTADPGMAELREETQIEHLAHAMKSKMPRV